MAYRVLTRIFLALTLSGCLIPDRALASELTKLGHAFYSACEGLLLSAEAQTVSPLLRTQFTCFGKNYSLPPRFIPAAEKICRAHPSYIAVERLRVLQASFGLLEGTVSDFEMDWASDLNKALVRGDASPLVPSEAMVVGVHQSRELQGPTAQLLASEPLLRDLLFLVYVSDAYPAVDERYVARATHVRFSFGSKYPEIPEGVRDVYLVGGYGGLCLRNSVLGLLRSFLSEKSGGGSLRIHVLTSLVYNNQSVAADVFLGAVPNYETPCASGPENRELLRYVGCGNGFTLPFSEAGFTQVQHQHNPAFEHSLGPAYQYRVVATDPAGRSAEVEVNVIAR